LAPFLLPLAVLLALLGAGCYTLLQHPRHQEATYSDVSGSCLGCHDADPGYSVSGLPWVDYYSYSSYPWINYYGSPWWYDATWEPVGTAPPSAADELSSPRRVLGLWNWISRPPFAARGGETDGDGWNGSTVVGPPIAAPRLPAAAPRPAAQPAGATRQESQTETEEPEEEAAKKPEKTDKPQPRVLKR
jgi:hypothetical protein